MNPIKVVEVEYSETFSGQQRVEIENTAWFDHAKKEPGQPGVFEVDPVQQFDDGTDVIRRFSFFNGKRFGPIASSPEAAYRERFGKTHLIVASFRGLVEQA